MSRNSFFNLEQRTALVTGSSRGIGEAIALGLAGAGARVIIHCCGDEDRANEVSSRITADGGEASVICSDMSEPDAPEAIYSHSVQAFGAVDILILNASVQIPKPWTGINSDDANLQIAVNYLSTLRLLQLAVPDMASRGWGRILTIGSVQELVPHSEMLVYSSLKSAQTALGYSLAKQYAAQGVTINNLAPGVIATDRYRERVRTEEQAERVRSWIPAGFVGEPNDCVAAALLFCSDFGRYITGQNLFVDGGMSLS